MTRIPYDVRGVSAGSVPRRRAEEPRGELEPPRVHAAPRRALGAPDLIRLSELGFAGEIVEALLPWTEADPAALLVDFLVSFGSAVGSGPYMYAGDARHDLKLFSVVVGPTSAGRKGTARAAIARLFAHAAPKWSNSRVQGGLSSGEGLIQAMANMDGPKNLLAVESEFGKVLVVAARNGNTVSDHLRQLWEGDRVRVLNRKPISLDGAHLSLIGHITQEELREKMAAVDLANGFANRILWVYSQRTQLLPGGSRVPDAVLRPLAKRLRATIAQARKPTGVHRDPRASTRWEELYLLMADTHLPGLLGAVTDRREAQCIRLGLIFAALDGRSSVKRQHVDAAWRVWRYCEESAAFVFGKASGNARSDKVLTALRMAPGGALPRSKIRSHILGDNATRSQLDGIRDQLVAARHIEVARQSTNGRPAEMWSLRD